MSELDLGPMKARDKDGGQQRQIADMDALLARYKQAATEIQGANDLLNAAVTERDRRFTAPIVCLCGSTRFYRAFDDWNYRLTLAGFIVLTIGCNTKTDRGLGITAEQKQALDALHKRKIDLCDWVWVLDVGGYIGESTRSEIEYALAHGKPVRYLSDEYPDYQEPIDPLTERDKRIAELARYAEHSPGCCAFDSLAGCTCGLRALLTPAPTVEVECLAEPLSLTVPICARCQQPKPCGCHDEE